MVTLYGKMRAPALVVGAATLICAMKPIPAMAQELIPYPRANRLTARVAATAELLGLDSMRVSHTLHNDKASYQRAHLLVVRTNAASAAQASGPWLYKTGTMQGWNAIAWVSTDSATDVAPADSVVGLSYEVVGEPDAVNYYVQGWVPPPELEPGVPNPYRPSLPVWQDSFSGWTLGAVPLGNMGAPNLAERLVAATSKACADPDFINEPTVCENPNSRPRLAERASLENNLPAACTNLEALIAEVAALSDAVITPEGRALLTIRAQQFIRRHCT